MVINRFGLTATLIAFPTLMLICTLFVWLMPNIWVVFLVMMVIKGMSYALLNPTKEILYQVRTALSRWLSFHLHGCIDGNSTCPRCERC
jgi:hypothetical protein